MSAWRRMMESRQADAECIPTPLSYDYQEWVLSDTASVPGWAHVSRYLAAIDRAAANITIWIFVSDRHGRCYRVEHRLNQEEFANAGDIFTEYIWRNKFRGKFGLLRVTDASGISELIADYRKGESGAAESSGSMPVFRGIADWPEDAILADGEFFILFSHDADVLYVMRNPVSEQ